MDDQTVARAVELVFNDWNEIKDTVPDFGFSEYMRRVHGITYRGGNIQDFKYTVIDEGNFMWFMLKYGYRNE